MLLFQKCLLLDDAAISTKSQNLGIQKTQQLLKEDFVKMVDAILLETKFLSGGGQNAILIRPKYWTTILC